MLRTTLCFQAQEHHWHQVVVADRLAPVLLLQLGPVPASPSPQLLWPRSPQEARTHPLHIPVADSLVLLLPCPWCKKPLKMSESFTCACCIFYKVQMRPAIPQRNRNGRKKQASSGMRTPSNFRIPSRREFAYRAGVEECSGSNAFLSFSYMTTGDCSGSLIPAAQSSAASTWWSLSRRLATRSQPSWAAPSAGPLHCSTPSRRTYDWLHAFDPSSSTTRQSRTRVNVGKAETDISGGKHILQLSMISAPQITSPSILPTHTHTLSLSLSLSVTDLQF